MFTSSSRRERGSERCVGEGRRGFPVTRSPHVVTLAEGTLMADEGERGSIISNQHSLILVPADKNVNALAPY